VEARRRQPALAVLVLSAYVEQMFATELLAGGARGLGYLLKERVGRVEEFLDALHRVAAGGTAVDPEVVAQLFARTRPDSRLVVEGHASVVGASTTSHVHKAVRDAGSGAGDPGDSGDLRATGRLGASGL